NRSAADFRTVDDDVVRLGFDRLNGFAVVLVVELRQVRVQRRGERVMRGGVTLFLLVVLEQREVDDPDPGVIGAGLELHIARHLQAQLAENFMDDLGAVRREGEEVTYFRAGARYQFSCDRLDELCDTRVETGACAPGYYFGDRET